MSDITTKGKKTNRKAKGKTQAASMSVPQSATKEQILRSALNVAVTGGSFIDTRIFCFSRRTHDGIVDRVRPVYANSDTLKIASGFFLSCAYDSTQDMLVFLTNFVLTALGGGWKEQIDSQPSTDCYEYDSDSDLELEDYEDAVPNDDLGELAAYEELFSEHVNAESEPKDGVKTEDVCGDKLHYYYLRCIDWHSIVILRRQRSHQNQALFCKWIVERALTAAAHRHYSSRTWHIQREYKATVNTMRKLFTNVYQSARFHVLCDDGSAGIFHSQLSGWRTSCWSGEAIRSSFVLSQINVQVRGDGSYYSTPRAGNPLT